jgi:hypothetical protein
LTPFQDEELEKMRSDTARFTESVRTQQLSAMEDMGKEIEQWKAQVTRSRTLNPKPQTLIIEHWKAQVTRSRTLNPKP